MRWKLQHQKGKQQIIKIINKIRFLLYLLTTLIYFVNLQRKVFNVYYSGHKFNYVSVFIGNFVCFLFAFDLLKDCYK